MAGRRCAVYSAPWLEVHLITELAQGGKTLYDNLIVLCPNCHTRVHENGIPSKTELRHQKLKQEAASELPVLGRLPADEHRLLQELALLSPEELVTRINDHFSPRIAKAHGTNQPKLKYLLGSGVLAFNPGNSDLDTDGKEYQLVGGLTVTARGVRWTTYLKETNRLPS